MEEAEDEPRVRDPQELAPRTSWFVGYQRSGAVRLSPFILQPVVPLPPTIRWMTTNPAPTCPFGTR